MMKAYGSDEVDEVAPSEIIDYSQIRLAALTGIQPQINDVDLYKRGQATFRDKTGLNPCLLRLVSKEHVD